MSSFALLRLAGLLAAASTLGACTQDEYSSNPNDRETHMGDIHAAAPPPTASAAAPLAAVPPAAPAPAPAPTPAPAAAASGH